LQRQLDLSQKLAASMSATYRGYNQVAKLRTELPELLKRAEKSPEILTAAEAIDKKAGGLADAAGPPAGLGPMNRDLTRLLIAVDQSDTAPASELIETYTGMCQDTRAAIARWNQLRMVDIPQLNTLLAKQSLATLTVPGQALPEPDCGN
jgi:hypothetical protein